jgi:hypothetical protein
LANRLAQKARYVRLGVCVVVARSHVSGVDVNSGFGARTLQLLPLMMTRPGDALAASDDLGVIAGGEARKRDLERDGAS